ncbi:MAG: DUF5719 family protein [Acidobacteriota bacterium]|nr:DUF5719 family protein [Acidobacteriota bacterium]
MLRTAALLFALCGLAFLTPPDRPSSQPTPSALSPQATLAHLQAQLDRLPEDSAEAARLRQKLQKVRRKAAGNVKTADNPGALWEGLNQIRTRADGSSYVPGYRVTQLQKARKRKGKRGKALPWQERGPGNVGGRTRAVVVDPTDPSQNTWLIASTGGGVWKTKNAGASWYPTMEDLPNMTTTTIAIAESNPSVMYVGTGRGYGSEYQHIPGDGIFKSTDGGETWTQLESTANGQLFDAINRIVVDPRDEKIVLACGNDKYDNNGQDIGPRRSGIYRSTNGGISWTKVWDVWDHFGEPTDNSVQQIVVTPGNPDVMYAAVNRMGVLVSRDGGQSWRVSDDTFAQPSGYDEPTDGIGASVRVELAIAPSEPTRLYASVERPRASGDIYMSLNAGDSWTIWENAGTEDPNWFNAFGLSGVFGQQGWFDNTITVHPDDPNYIIVGGVNLYGMYFTPHNQRRNTRAIGWWTENAEGISVVHADHHFLTVIPRGGVNNFQVLDANDGGIGISDDSGQTWRQMANMQTTQFYDVDKKPGENVYIGGMQDNGTWISGPDPDNASDWTFAAPGDGFQVAWHATDPNLVMSSAQYGYYRRSTDGGKTWKDLISISNVLGPFISKIAYSRTDPDLIFTMNAFGIRRSDDFGETWTLVTPSRWGGVNTFDDLAVSIADPRVVWATSRAVVVGGFYNSDDSGATWNKLETSALPDGLRYSSGIATHPTDPKTAYLMFSAPGLPKLMRTTDQGLSWEDLSGFGTEGVSANGFPDVSTFCALVMPHDPNIIWVGTDIGLVVSQDGGKNWEIADNGLPNTAIFKMKIVEGQILVATYGRGVWTLDLPELSDYRPPQVTLTPRLRNAAVRPNGNFSVDFDLRGTYDSTRVLINGEPVEEMDANTRTKNLLRSYPVTAEGIVTFQIECMRDGERYVSAIHELQAYAAQAVSSYSNDFNETEDGVDFFGDWFGVGINSQFDNGGLHSFHDYDPYTDSITVMEVPIRILSESMTLSYEDIALIAPGAEGSVYGEEAFGDYAVIEGTTDGINWLPVAPGYDARANSKWLDTLENGNGVGNKDLYVRHDIDLLQTFNPGDVITLRFRIHSTDFQTTWGWVIDNLEINGSGDFLPEEHRHVYPWVSNNSTFRSVVVVNNNGNERAEVTLTARREDGQEATAGPYLLKPKGFLRMEAAEMFPSLGDGAGFAVEMVANSADVRGRWVTNNLLAATGKSPSQGVAVNIDTDFSGRLGDNLLFGYLPQENGLISAPVLVNTGDAPANVSLSFYSRDGVLLGNLPDALLLEPKRPYARLVSDLLPGVTEDISLVASSDGAPLTGVVFVFNPQNETAIGNASAFKPDDTTARDLLYPWVSNNTAFDSLVVVNNTGTSAATVNLTAARTDGPSEMVTRTVPAGGFLLERAGNLFTELGEGSGYAIRLTTDAPGIHGRWVTNNLAAASGSSPGQGVAIPVTDEETNVRMGRAINFGFLPLTDGLFSAPVVVNTGTEPSDVILYFYSEDGALLKTDSETLAALPPNRPFATVANTLIGDIGEDVYMVAVSAWESITGVAFVFNTGNEPAIGNVTRLPEPEIP